MRVSMKVVAAMMLLAAVIAGGSGKVQAQAQAQGSKNTEPPVPLKVTVTIARFEGEKKTASLPFMLWVNTGSSASVQMGGEVPVPQTTFSSIQNGASTPTTSFTYRALGTQINCDASTVSDGLYRISLNVSDSQIFRQGPASSLGPVFQSFRSQNSPLLRDGQTVQFAVATDKTSGEVIKLDVTLNLVK